jgi:hypothetical protein
MMQKQSGPTNANQATTKYGDWNLNILWRTAF